MNKLFKYYGHYYNLLYKDKNYAKESKYIKHLIDRFGKKKKELLEFGSGTGDHGRYLVKSGFKVHGIEISQEMINLSKKIKGFSCQQGDITKVNMKKTYDCVLSLFHVVNYLNTNKKINAVFYNAANHLNKDGLFIFDFWYTPAVIKQKPGIRIKRSKNKKVKITRIAEPKIYHDQSRVDVKYNFFLQNLNNGLINFFEEVHPLRHFNLIELKEIGKKNNFKLVNSEEFITGAKLSDQTWSACVVFKKIQ